MPSSLPSPAPSRRDRRLDVFRGIALMMIFINHVPGTIYENLTNRNFGFSDAAEGFVLMSGIAAALAYSASFRSGAIVEGIERMWKRAGHLYNTHVVAAILGIAIMAAGARFLRSEKLLDSNNVTPMIDDPLGGLLGFVSLTHQPGYFNILPLYAVLLLAGPFLIMLGLRSRGALLLGSVGLWVIAGLYRLNFPNYPNQGGWFFNPFSWQLIFVIGLLGGMAMKEGRKLVPYSPTLFAAALTYLIASAVWTVFGLWGLIGDLGLPFFLQDFDKTFASLPRLLHVLAVAYVLTNLDVVKAFAAHRWSNPLAKLGQNGLAVFASGSVICILFQVIKQTFTLNVVQDGVLLATGIAVQYAIALYFGREKAKVRAAVPARTEPKRTTGNLPARVG